jgi:hypothetical protein
MQNGRRKRLRWDRIGAVIGLFVLGLFGLAGMVPEGDSFRDATSEGHVAVALSFPLEAENAGQVDETAHAPSEATEPQDASSTSESIEEEVETSGTAIAPVPSGPLPRRGMAPCSCSKHTMSLARNPYTRHQSRARTLPGSFFVKDQSELVAGAERGALKRVPAIGKGYHLYGLKHSEPFLLPAAKKVLETMASRFADAMEGTSDEGASIRITSLTRTESQQRRLRRRNANAFKGQSTHSYGASFDVAFIDRPNETVGCSGPSWALQSILQDMQEKGEILVIPEGSCMHITPRKS